MMSPVCSTARSSSVSGSGAVTMTSCHRRTERRVQPPASHPGFRASLLAPVPSANAARLNGSRPRGGTVDITQLILDDHHEQRRLFAILEQISPADTGTLTALWSRLGVFLELHAAAEEAVFYPALLRVGLLARQQAGAEAETL